MLKKWLALALLLSGLALGQGINVVNGRLALLNLTIADWQEGQTGVVRLTADGGQSFLSEAPVGPDGKFILRLPQPDSSNLRPANEWLQSERCAANPDLSLENVGLGNYSLMVFLDNQPYSYVAVQSGATQPPDLGTVYAELRYAQDSLVINGLRDCPGNEVQNYTAQEVPAGWSLWTYAYVVSDETGDLQRLYQIVQETTDFQGYMSREFGGIGISYTESSEGFKVVRLLEGGPAAKAGLQLNDLIVAVNSEPIANGWDFVSRVRGESGTPVRLSVMRGNDTFELAIEREIIRSLQSP